jgi:hypothetical protein
MPRPALAKRLVRAAKTAWRAGPISVEVQGRGLRCWVGGHDELRKEAAEVWTYGARRCYVRGRGGYSHWFLAQPA